MEAEIFFVLNKDMEMGQSFRFVKAPYMILGPIFVSVMLTFEMLCFHVLVSNS